MALRTDVKIIWDHFVRTAFYLAVETILKLFFLRNPAKFPPELVNSIERFITWFIVATLFLFSVTCFVLLVRSSVLEVLSRDEDEKNS